MPKQKTHKGTKKRFRLTGNGKVKHRSAGTSHLASRMAQKRTRHLRGTTVLSCAGCHAPSKFLGPERKIGCGLTWPDTLGEVHIGEKGALSEAMTSVFLPRRASVLQTFAQACDMAAISENLLPTPPTNDGR